MVLASGPSILGLGSLLLLAFRESGASGGIGYELAKLFAHDHHNLVLVARSGPQAHAICHFRSTGGPPGTIRMWIKGFDNGAKTTGSITTRQSQCETILLSAPLRLPTSSRNRLPKTSLP